MLLLLAALAAQTPLTPSPRTSPPPARHWPVREGDVVLKDFRFRSGQSLPELRMHYRLLGTPHRDAAGRIDNAVMVLHGTGGTGAQFLSPQFADELYGPGQPLDIRRIFVILPDNLGHGASSKPSDGLHMRFPAYDYDDMVEAQRRMLADGLGVTHLRLIMGTSMGCMHSFVWAEEHPDAADALMPLACEPVEIAGLNRMWRQLAIDGIKADPAWAGGEYRQPPLQGLRTAESLLFIAGSAPLYLQATYPTRPAASAYASGRVTAGLQGLDANDLVYQLDASRTYNPWPRLEAIRAPMTWINSADDFINPRNLPFPPAALKRMPTVRYRLIPESAETRGHGTHTWARFWKADLSALLARTAPASGRTRRHG
ncbi:alpha/beta fold hydrolase [Sphingomonas ginkgonis]|uniref:Alpha/beta fold hydrolase n=1 Tax=Sphingomonas ginkgonis TaxID=2315330 RepID=A0A3R9YNS0_9SPHN|nr:alpha/beta fold hydrolase [Sphingomonas ginkgonis]RST31961.1 alpha/beta fold hydrolase [Sphingomonas ginkgonis]